MIVNDKSDILSDILRSFHNDTTVRCQESNNLNELAVQHPGKECQPSQNVQTCHPVKNAKICGLEEKRETSRHLSLLQTLCLFFRTNAFSKGIKETNRVCNMLK